MARRLDNLKKGVKITKETAKEMGRKGGLKKGENSKERLLMSQIYANFIAEHKAELEEALEKVAKRGDASTISLLSELRKGTEGEKTEVTAKVATAEMTREEMFDLVFGK